MICFIAAPGVVLVCIFPTIVGFKETNPEMIELWQQLKTSYGEGRFLLKRTNFLGRGMAKVFQRVRNY